MTPAELCLYLGCSVRAWHAKMVDRSLHSIQSLISILKLCALIKSSHTFWSTWNKKHKFSNSQLVKTQWLRSNFHQLSLHLHCFWCQWLLPNMHLLSSYIHQRKYIYPSVSKYETFWNIWKYRWMDLYLQEGHSGIYLNTCQLTLGFVIPLCHGKLTNMSTDLGPFRPSLSW